MKGWHDVWNETQLFLDCQAVVFQYLINVCDEKLERVLELEECFLDTAAWKRLEEINPNVIALK